MTDNEIIQEIERQTGQTVTRNTIYKTRQQMKKESYDWFNTLRQDRYSYLHEFKERINEIMDLQKKCHELIESNKHNPQIQLSAIAELHRLNITLSNYIEVIPTVINGCTISTTPEDKTTESEESTESIITV